MVESTEIRERISEEGTETGERKFDERTVIRQQEMEEKTETGERKIDERTVKGERKIEEKTETGERKFDEKTETGERKIEEKTEIRERKIGKNTEIGECKIGKTENHTLQIEKFSLEPSKKMRIRCRTRVYTANQTMDTVYIADADRWLPRSSDSEQINWRKQVLFCFLVVILLGNAFIMTPGYGSR